MKLTPQESAIMQGKEGETLAKIMRTVVEFGELFDADHLADTTHAAHLVTSFGLGLLKPLYRIMKELNDNNITAKEKFTADPRPIDYKNVKCNILEKLVFSKIMYSAQDDYEQMLIKAGLKDRNSFTCACYLDEVGNTPKYGDTLPWAESSAVVYANSVLGARCNRNSGVLELFYGILGKVPYYGLLTDEGRKADWIVEIATSSIPEAQILGSAIGIKVMEDVPYIIGLDKYLGNTLNDFNKSYLKDMGAATASNGAVGLYHVDGLTPDATKYGKELIKPDAKVYVIDDNELQRIQDSYPNMWKEGVERPKLAFIGCPHLSYSQLIDWTNKISESLQKSGLKKVSVRTVLTTAPDVREKFVKTDDYQRLLATGATLSSICPLMYMNNPIANKKPVATNSNKLRTYTNARYYKDADILKVITQKEGN